MAAKRRRRRGARGGSPPGKVTDALVARINDYGESSAVVVLVTADLGAVRAVAKGARRIANSFRGPLDRGVLYRVRVGRRGRASHHSGVLRLMISL